MKHLIKFNENLNNLKLYYFNPNGYDMEYIILESSPENALNSLKQYLYNKMSNDSDDKMFTKSTYEYWQNANVDMLPDKYTIEIFEKGEVLETEIS